MKERVKSVGSFPIYLGISIVVLFVVGFVTEGALWLDKIVYPYLVGASFITLLICATVLLPSAIFPRSRVFAGNGFFLSSYVFGLSLWLWAFLLTYMLWGTVALIVGVLFLGVGIVPIAVLATAFNGEWSICTQLALLVLLTYGARVFGIYLAGNPKAQSAPKVYQTSVAVLNNFGIDTREAGILAKLAQTFDSDICLKRNDAQCDAKDIISIMTLAAEQGATLTLKTVGSDAEEAFIRIAELLNSGFDDGISEERRRKSMSLLQEAEELRRASKYQESARLAELAIQTDPNNPYAVAYFERISKASPESGSA